MMYPLLLTQKATDTLLIYRTHTVIPPEISGGYK